MAQLHVRRHPAEEYVAELKQGNGGDIGIHGSIRLAQSLIAAGWSTSCDSWSPPPSRTAAARG